MFDRVLNTPLINYHSVLTIMSMLSFNTFAILFTLMLCIFTKQNLRKLSQRNIDVGISNVIKII